MPDNTGTDNLYIDPLTLNVYWGRLLMHEVFLTFIFSAIYLVIRFEQSMKKVDRLIKGLGVTLALTICLQMTAGSGGCLNPALGLAQSLYMIGLDNRNGFDTGSKEAKYMWVYIIGPFVGALIAALFF